MKQAKLFSLSRALLVAVLCLLGATGEAAPQREDLFRVGFGQIPEVINFVVGSPDFNAQLTEAEKLQLKGLYRVTETVQASFDAEIFKESYPQVAAPKLEFSSDPNLFKLTPEQPERSAATNDAIADPIYVNLRILNSEKLDPSYLDIIQILIHELGHKLGSAKDQAAMDALGAKIIRFIRPYYQSAFLSQRTRVEMLSFPRPIRSISFGSPRQDRILLSQEGKVLYHVLGLQQSLSSLEKYNPSENTFGSVMENLTFRLTDFQGTSAGFHTKLNFNVELRSSLDFMNSMVGMNMSSAFGGDIGGWVPMQPRASFHHLIQPVAENIRFSVNMNAPDPEDRNDISQYYLPDGGRWDYKDTSLSKRVTSVSTSGSRITVEFTTPVTDPVKLRIRSEAGDLLLHAKEHDQLKFSFVIPDDLKTASGEVKIRDVVIGTDSSSELPEVLSHQVPISNETFSWVGFTYFNGESWRPYSAEELTKLPAGPIRFRFAVQGSGEVRQLRMRWNKGALVSWQKPEEVVGVYSLMEEEVIEDLKLVSNENGVREYEFESTQVLEPAYPQVLESVIGVADSRRRVLKEFYMTSSNLETKKAIFTNHLKIFNREYLEVQGAVQSCSSVFN